MMGSDSSYEDMMEDHKLSQSYIATFNRIRSIKEVEYTILNLAARDKKTTYQTRKVWINPKDKTILQNERFAKTGKLLKRILFKEYELIDDRIFPRTMIFKDF